ncbi:ABC transporter substrate-binding protein [Kallotenue papyrolyticum]|uniref:ABC transporter substrate-binding protein n=1 Tax=Kallotenue papyrolyticum TaxID=1325125 RepID=UPI000492667B|nr:ABC transporter substrate-binding protein [Kallotenue papyrolyticum]
MRRLSLALLALALLISGCRAAATPPSTAATGGARTPVRIAMGYIPDVQFAPFYVAQARGYYQAAGLEVTIDHSDVRDALVQVGQGRLTFANAAGDEILQARAQGIPIKLVFQTFQQLPVAIFAKQSAGIKTPADLRGKTVGVPGRFGATYIGLLAVLYAAQVPADQVNIVEIGFTQAAAVREDKVDAAVGYFNNEPLLLQAEGIPVDVLPVSEYISLVSNGIIAADTLIETQPDLVRRFVSATARGLQETIADPEAAFRDALRFIPELPAERQAFELNKLKQTTALWQSAVTQQHGLGYSDPAAWETTYRFLRESGLLQAQVEVTSAFTNDLRP